MRDLGPKVLLMRCSNHDFAEATEHHMSRVELASARRLLSPLKKLVRAPVRMTSGDEEDIGLSLFENNYFT